MKRTLAALLCFSAVSLNACAGGSPSMPSIASGSGAQSGTATSPQSPPTLKTNTAGVATATHLYVDDNGTMKVYAASASGAASYTPVTMPSTWSQRVWNEDSGAEFAVTPGGSLGEFFYSIPNGQLVWCTTKNVQWQKGIYRQECLQSAVLTDTNDLALANESPGVDIVYDAGLNMIVSLNAQNGRIALYQPSSSSATGNTLTLLSSITIPGPLVNPMKIAVEPDGMLWVLYGESVTPIFVGITSSPWQLHDLGQKAWFSLAGTGSLINAYDINDNAEAWVGELDGALVETNEGTGATMAYEPGEYYSQLDVVRGLATDQNNVYAVGDNMIEVYPDNAATETQPSRTITGLTSPDAIEIL